MCHLALEKALKGILIKQKNIFPPKTHNLAFLIENIDLKINEEDKKFLFTLNKIYVPTRYPESLSLLMDEYNKDRTNNILNTAQRIQSWIIKNY